MAVYPKSFTTNNFIPQSDGRFMALIPVTTHNLGTKYHVAKMVRRDDDMNWHNMLLSLLMRHSKVTLFSFKINFWNERR